MKNTKTKYTHKKTTMGFSLIELMIAMVIGVILLLGLVSLFTNTSVLSRAQTGLSLLQENGRYAITRIKQDLEQAGRRHCASVTLPANVVTDWNQGYEMAIWYATDDATFTNGLPVRGDVQMDGADADQLGDTFAPAAPVPPAPGSLFYPIDSMYFIKGHECGVGACVPDLSAGAVLGADWLTNFRSIGTADNTRAASTDVLTVRYLTGGTPVAAVAGNVITLTDTPLNPGGDALIADCNGSFVDQAVWGGNAVTTANLVEIDPVADGRVYSMDNEFLTVSYFIGIDTDSTDPSRMISSLYRSENGVAQQIVEGVERLDFFYLAQLQTGQVARLTADQIQNVSGGGNFGNPAACILPSTAALIPGLKMANDPGCLWRSIYAIEVHLLLNTVSNSSVRDDDVYIYSPDGDAPQDPTSGLPSGLPGERMYRREFTAIVPVRSYTL